MARVPKIKRVTAGDIGTVQTTLPQVTEARGFDIAGKALTQLGADISGEADKFAQLGAQLQARDEAREVQARTIRYKQDLFDLTYGNREKGIVGYRNLKGQAAIDGAEEFRRKAEELRRANAREITNSRVAAGFKASSEAERQAAYTMHGNYTVGERETAQNATDLAHLGALMSEITADPNNPLNTARRVQIVDITLEMASRQGITDPVARQQMVMANLTAAHKGAIKKMLDEGNAVGADAYFNLHQAEILPETRGELTKSIRVGNTTAEAQQKLDAILINPTLDTPEKRLAEARKETNPGVRAKLVDMTRLHNADVVRQERQRITSLRRSATEKANKGYKTPQGAPDPLTSDEQEAVASTPGMATQLQKIAERFRTGRPIVSDQTTRGEAFKLRRDDPAAFAEEDFDGPKWVKLSITDRDKFQAVQIAMDKSEARKQSADQKEYAKGERLNRALAATRGILRGLKLDVEERGNIEAALTIEIERLTAEGVKLSDSDYQDIVRGLVLEGEETGSGLIEEDDIKLFEAIAGDVPFNIKDFASENEDLMKRLAKGAEISVEDTAIVVANLAQAGFVPTVRSVRKEFERLRRLQEQAQKKSPEAVITTTKINERETQSLTVIPTENLRGSGNPVSASNNPGNIRATDIEWEGKTGSKNGFEVFDTPESGVRAVGKLLQTYEDKGFNTIEKIISRYAPPSDNNPTENYIDFVAKRTGFERDEVISARDEETLKKIVSAIIFFEGSKNFDQGVITAGIGRLF